MAGLGGELGSGERSMDEGGRTEANFRRKRGLSQGSGSEDASERVVRRKIDQEGFKVLVKFKEGHDIKSVGPVALTKYLREKVGEGCERSASILGERTVLGTGSVKPGREQLKFSMLGPKERSRMLRQLRGCKQSQILRDSQQEAESPQMVMEKS
uniref:Uncharacterized protein n=1 Tax=Knipowitschia caucasica TaxID=637954 RepID=A0AAV2LQ50_KNICA